MLIYGKFELWEPRVNEYEVRRELGRTRTYRRFVVLTRTTDIHHALDVAERAANAEDELDSAIALRYGAR